MEQTAGRIEHGVDRIIGHLHHVVALARQRVVPAVDDLAGLQIAVERQLTRDQAPHAIGLLFGAADVVALEAQQRRRLLARLLREQRAGPPQQFFLRRVQRTAQLDHGLDAALFGLQIQCFRLWRKCNCGSQQNR
ncbi:hypothetical protein D3C81_1211710 [compost metagenome]